MLRRVLVGAAGLIGAWTSAAGVLLGATVMLELLAWPPLHRGNHEDAEPFLRSGAALSRAAPWIRVPDQRVRLARHLGDLAEAREQRGAAAEAAELYLESIAILEAEHGEAGKRGGGVEALVDEMHDPIVEPELDAHAGRAVLRPGR